MSSSEAAGSKGKPEGKAEAKKSKKSKGKKQNKGGNVESDSTTNVNTDNANAGPNDQQDEPKPEGTDNQAKPDKNGDATDNTEKPKSGKAGKQGKSKAQNGMEVATALFGLDKFKAKPEKKDFKFWGDQPVLKMDQKADDHGPIESKKLDEVKKDPYNLPTGFAWETIDMSDEKLADEVYSLLTNHYVEDDDAQFRFDYSKPFLSWALKPPGYIKDWHVGVREIAGKKRLLGFITGIPVDIRAHDKPLKVAEINFLCVHKALRSKRLAPVLIMEITRRVNLTGIWQAVYTAGVVIPKPIARNRYWHRSLNPKKLIEIGFSRLAPKMTMTMTIKLYQLPNAPATKGIRPMEKKDVPQAMALLNKYLSKFKLVQEFHEEEFAHWFLPRAGIMNAYVVEGADHKITDMCSFYTLNSSVIKNPKHPTLNAAYSFYNVSTKTPMQELMTDALVLARQAGYDVFNALDVMENEKFFKGLKFGIGDGHLQYYLYNWRCPDMTADQVGLVLM